MASRARAPCFERLDLLALHPFGNRLNAAVGAARQRRRLRFQPLVDADHDLVARLDLAKAHGVRLDEALLHVARLDGRDGAAHRFDAGQFLARLGFQLFDLGFDDVRAVENIGIFEEIGLVGERSAAC